MVGKGHFQQAEKRQEFGKDAEQQPKKDSTNDDDEQVAAACCCKCAASGNPTTQLQMRSSVLGPVRSNMFESDTRIGWYNLGNPLGGGGSGQVRLGKHCLTQRHYAIKVVAKKAEICSSGTLRMLENEVNILRNIKHANIIGFKQTIHTPNQVYVIMNLGGENLRDYSLGIESVPRRLLQQLMVGVLLGLQHLHRICISHLDMKPENIVVNPNVKPLELTSKDVKIIDFGHAIQAKTVYGFGGTPGFFAPELVGNTKGFDGCAADMFSVGATFGDVSRVLDRRAWQNLYVSNWNKTECRIQDCTRFRKEMEATIKAFKRDSDRGNDELKRLIANLLSVNPRFRLSAKGALKHRFFLDKT